MRDAIVLDLGDLVRQGDQVRARARADAAAILVRAAAERDRLLAGAHEEGFARGQAEGRERGMEEGREAGFAHAQEERRAELARLEAAWGEALNHFMAQRDHMLMEAKQDVLRLGVMLGEKVTRRTIAHDPSVVLAQMEAVLALISKATRLTMSVHPDDLGLARQALPGVLARFHSAQHVELLTDPAVERGSCSARTAGGGLIDASIGVQLDRIVKALLPASEVRPPDTGEAGPLAGGPS
jgi:flagellar assembly protein FliH